MNRFLLFAMVSLGLMASESTAQRDGGWQRVATRNGWRLDYREALAEARKTGKPLMVVLRCVP